MDTLLTALGLLLVATGITLLSAEPRSWLIALAQGLGVQAIVGGIASAVQVIWLMHKDQPQSVPEQVITGVQGLPFNAAGWTARAGFEAFTTDKNPGAMSNLGDYLPIAVLQMAIVAAVLASRKMRDEGLTDPLQILVWGLLITNTVCNLWWPWWGQ